MGTCPNNLTREEARDILNSGLPYFDDDDPERSQGAFPDKVFAVYKGVPYESRQTIRGKSFHGFPVLPERFARLPQAVQEWLRAAVAKQGHRIEDWLNQWKL